MDHIYGNKHGFTLIELLIVIAIFLLIAGLSLPFSISSFRGYIFYQEQDTIISLLQKARSQSVNNIGQQPHGVHVDDNEYVLFSGPVYRADDPDNIKFDASGGINNNGPLDIIFNQLDGSSGGGNLRLFDGGGHIANININSEGQINY